jgi:signal transduction histidine kinase
VKTAPNGLADHLDTFLSIPKGPAEGVSDTISQNENHWGKIVLAGTAIAVDPLRREQTIGPGRGMAEIGRLALVAGVIALAAVLAVGFVVARAAHDDLLAARTMIYQGVVDDLIDQGLIPIESGNAETFAALDSAVRLRLLGGETVRVKLWSPQGQIVYSDATELIGGRFDLDQGVAGALDGVATVELDDLSAAENLTEQGFEQPLLEYYLPVLAAGEVVGAFEIYEESTSFSSSLTEIRGHVWTAVAIGLGALVVAFGSIAVRHARGQNRWRREAERHLAEVLTAADDERRRIVGALHDDIGQPLYRIQYGLEGCLRLLPAGGVASEIEGLIGLVGGIDSSLRSELAVLYSGLVEGDGLAEALERLAQATTSEGGLDVSVTGEELPGVSGTAATAMFRAAQEAVINARKHAQASRITIGLQGVPGRATVTVADNGRGWNGRVGIGLATTRQRLAAVDGTMRIERRGSKGTLVSVSVPTNTAVSRS